MKRMRIAPSSASLAQQPPPPPHPPSSATSTAPPILFLTTSPTPPSLNPSGISLIRPRHTITHRNGGPKPPFFLTLPRALLSVAPITRRSHVSKWSDQDLAKYSTYDPSSSTDPLDLTNSSEQSIISSTPLFRKLHELQVFLKNRMKVN